MTDSPKHAPYEHRYKVGDMVMFDPRYHLNGPRGTFSVLAQLPPLDGDLQYRIKNVNEVHQRVVAENRLIRPSQAVS